MEAWPIVATAVRLGGAAYLAYLGVRLIISWSRRRAVPADVSPSNVQSARTLLAVGFANNLFNPKALLFFSVFIPQFVNPNLGSSEVQIAILGSMLSLLAFGYNVLLSLVFSSMHSFRIDLSRFRTHGDGFLGVLFLLLATRLSLAKVN